ncbi:MAG: diguanylate cyclase/phosphodiesterase (GGDEF & EAL domains) with PAS/PAC sensor(s) [uncultured Chloroflexia bacterium]|uniref:Diguanylate cyclase/phosphodiesterase (GGDEF & EAL domains) with PAS/PAC sensor(S) n=1 Tax=uncultured Chloroflexia bacterium TaxID=1672391 RepID=A0A6J4LEW7_9CHLR|nr:MAG: diguanylate cyclase/phosphodiesterase (GGDEF & EAL domains) with PAS/PAC sensor(s) [uncultured Chloroflexia bacterium]
MKGSRASFTTLSETQQKSGSIVPLRASYSKPISLVMLLLLGLAALHFSWLVFRWGAEAHQLFLGNVLYILPTLVAALVTLAAALKHQGKARRGWLLVGLGLAALGVGNSIWGYLELVPKIESFPSSGDFFYLMFGPLLAAGLFQLMPPLRNRLEGSRLALDLAITVGAVGLYFWRFLLAPPLAWGMGFWATSVSFAYPLLDLLLLSLLLLIVMRKPRDEPPRPELVVMGLGIAAQVGADLLFNAAITAGTYYSGHPLDGLWTASAAFIALSACTSLAQQRATVSQNVAVQNGYFAVALPYLAVVAGFGLLLVTETNPAIHDSLGARGVLYGAVVVTSLVVVRQLLAFSENWRLAQHLARQSETLAQQSETLVRQSETLEVKVQERTAELEALSNRYRHDALHDTLTSLPNRAHFQKQLRQFVTQDRPFAALYLDFDRFKAVNDSYGHAVGDALLVAIGERLEASMRPGDLVARLGGDEFAVLLGDPNDITDAVQVAERLVQVFQAPLQVGNHTLYCTTSIGIVTGHADRNSAENVLRDADIAMYRAKALGKSRFVVFEPAMRENIQARTALESDLHVAVEREELVVYYQPMLHSPSGTLAGFEALVRWQHPEHGLVPPSEFVPLAEESGLIIGIDRWVLKTACAQLKTWLPYSPELTLSVNLSSRQFTRPDLPSFVAGVLTEFRLEPRHLTLELTEGLLMDHSSRVSETLTALRQLGIKLHIDDFGTGYSSLAYLQRFDADTLKVDRSFVMRMLESEDSTELVRTIINMAHNLKMKVVAEGVETNEQYTRLRDLGCEYVQGYLFSKPVPADSAALFLPEKARYKGGFNMPF